MILDGPLIEASWVIHHDPLNEYVDLIDKESEPVLYVILSLIRMIQWVLDGFSEQHEALLELLENCPQSFHDSLSVNFVRFDGRDVV